jgi:chromosome partitioning protein
MKKIVIATQKGGGAKTTLAANLAVAIHEAGDGPVAINDTDPQETLTKWLNLRAAEHPQIFTLDLNKDVDQQFAAVANLGFKYSITDTPPALSQQNVRMMRCADLVIVPCQPSAPDLWTLPATLELVRQSGAPFVFVMTHAKLNANTTSGTAAALSAHGRVMNPIIRNSVNFAASMTDGRTVLEVYPKHPATQDIIALWANLKKHIRELAKNSETAKNPIGERMHA